MNGTVEKVIFAIAFILSIALIAFVAADSHGSVIHADADSTQVIAFQLLSPIGSGGEQLAIDSAHVHCLFFQEGDATMTYSSWVTATSGDADSAMIGRIMFNGDTNYVFRRALAGMLKIDASATPDTAYQGYYDISVNLFAAGYKTQTLMGFVWERTYGGYPIPANIVRVNNNALANNVVPVDVIRVNNDALGSQFSDLLTNGWDATNDVIKADLVFYEGNTDVDGNIQSEATDALNAYDPPTKAEMDAGHGAVTVSAISSGAIDSVDFAADAKKMIAIRADSGTAKTVGSINSGVIDSADFAADAKKMIAIRADSGTAKTVGSINSGVIDSVDFALDARKMIAIRADSGAAGGGLDSATTSRIIGRKVWGIAAESGSDSSTSAQRTVDVDAISGDFLVPDNLESILDGTGGQKLTLRGLNIIAGGTDSSAVYIAGNGAGHGIYSVGGATGSGAYFAGGATSGSAMRIESDGSSAASALRLRYKGTGSGIDIANNTAGQGVGIKVVGGDEGITVQSGSSADAITVASGTGSTNAVRLQGGSTGGNGLQILGAGASSGVSITGGATGNGVTISGGATSGIGLKVIGTGDSSAMRLDADGAGSSLDIQYGSTGGGRDVNGLWSDTNFSQSYWDSITATVPSAATISDAVWDEDTTGHYTAGLYGYEAAQSGAGSSPWSTAQRDSVLRSLEHATGNSVARIDDINALGGGTGPYPDTLVMLDTANAVTVTNVTILVENASGTDLAAGLLSDGNGVSIANLPYSTAVTVRMWREGYVFDDSTYTTGSSGGATDTIYGYKRATVGAGSASLKRIWGVEDAQGYYVKAELVKPNQEDGTQLPFDTISYIAYSYKWSDEDQTNADGSWAIEVPQTSRTMPSFDRVRFTCTDPRTGETRWSYTIETTGAADACLFNLVFGIDCE